MEKNKIVLVPPTRLEGRKNFPLPCTRRNKYLAVEISQVDFSGSEQRVWGEDLAPLLVSITTEAVAKMGQGCWWRVCLVGYQYGVEVGTLRNGRVFILGSDWLSTLRRYEGGLLIFGGSCGGVLSDVWTARCRIRATGS